MVLAPAIAVSLIAAAPATPDRVESEPRCGSYCLYVALRSLDLPVSSFEELEDKLGPPTPAGYSLGQLQDVAQQFGAQTLGVQTSFENLRVREERFACIAHLEAPGHFVNFADVTDAGLVTVIDPPRSYSAPADTLRTRWKGAALLLSPNPLTPEEDLRRPWPVAVLYAIAGVGLLAVIGLVALRKRSS
jgi:ABC-type bacteriocin/lantibiotic exporter with double-glycine peptidase domain